MMSPTNRKSSSVPAPPAGNLAADQIRVRDHDVLGLAAVEVAEGQTHPEDHHADAFAGLAAAAGVAVAAIDDARDDDTVAGLHEVHPGADVGDRAEELVAEAQVVLELELPRVGRDVGATDRRHLDLQHDLALRKFGRRRDVLDLDLVRALQDNRAHRRHGQPSAGVGNRFQFPTPIGQCVQRASPEVATGS
jgi:hypothetical protein